jgi:TfoX/Sxy family transcriptional regulator of competence genes
MPMNDQAPRALFDELVAALLSGPGISRKRLFGRDGLRSRDSFFAFFDRDRLVLKLPEPLAAALVASGQAAVATDVSPTMRKWVAVSAPSSDADRSRWRDLLDEAHTYADPPD